MAHDSKDFSSPQEAIEGYLEALLQDVAEYDLPETSEPEVLAKPEKHSDVADESGYEVTASETRSTETEQAKSFFAEEGDADPKPRVFAPPSAREYAREAASQIRQRQRLSKDQESAKLDLAFQESPPVVMPELKVAEPEIDTVVQTEALVEQPVAEPSPSLAEPEVSIAEPEVSVTEPEVSIAEPEVTPEQEVSVSDATETDTLAAPKENEGWTDGRPDWAQGRFECLLFDVKGLKLAVPLAELGGIHKLEKEPTPLFGQPGWFLGIVRTNNMNVGLVDTAQWVMSEHISDNHKPDFRFAIRIHNSEWGLACHEVAQAISLDPDEVKWRTSLGRRPWLAGTVVDHMCALIDVAAFARLLDSDKVPVDLQALMADEE